LLAHARDQQTLREGRVILTDQALAGRDLERYATEQVKVLLFRPDRRDEPYRFGDLSGVRQWIESVNDTPSKATGPGTPRRAYSGRGVRPHRATPARSGRRDLAQLAHQRTGQAIPDRLTTTDQ
jgi:hypothetical protein